MTFHQSINNIYLTMNDKLNLQQLFLKILQVLSIFYIFVRISDLYANGSFEILNSSLIFTGFQIITGNLFILSLCDLIRIINKGKNYDK